LKPDSACAVRRKGGEGAFALEAWWIARSRSPAVSDGVLRFIFTAQDANREEVEQVAASREAIIENFGSDLRCSISALRFMRMSFGTA
jgi:hypothetical protein